MRSARLTVPVAALFAIAACGDPVSTSGLIDDSAVTLDVAASAGDAVVTMLGTMVANETLAGGSAALSTPPTIPPTLEITRSHSCYDAAGAAVTNCLPFSSVRMIVTVATIDGSRTNTRTNAQGATVSWTGAVHRVMSDTTSRVFTGSTETARVHTHVALGHDSTTFTDATLSRRLAEAVRDSVKALRFDLPRSSNPYPVSGSIVRNVTVDLLVTSGTRSASASRSHRIEVVFPADAQANVTLNVDAVSCKLNLVTRAVTNCQ
jgi:hypothetical protein